MTDPELPQLPLGFGNEEETMLMVGPAGEPYDSFHEANSFVSNLGEFIPSDIKHISNGGKRFLQNGSVAYNGGTTSILGANLERATPECSTPEEFATAVEVNEQLLVRMLGTYLERMAKVGEPEAARIQRRVADSHGNTRASHDSFEMRNREWLRSLGYSKTGQILMATHLATRSFMTGAGYVTDHGLKYAQKVQHTKFMNNYGFMNSAYRTVTDQDTGPRLEIRCNDINISPWALRMRVGTSALFLTMLQTPLDGELREGVPNRLENKERWLRNFRRFNVARMDITGKLQSTPNIMAAIDFQERTYDIADIFLRHMIEIPPEYEQIIEEGSRYCQDFRSVLMGKKDLDSLRDRSDVAAKFSKIAQSMKAGREMGFERKPTDMVSRLWDMRYDLIELKPGITNKPRVEYGYGYRYRDHGGFQNTVNPTDLEHGLYHPPTTTRAYIRGNMIRKGLVDSCEWENLKIDVSAEEDEEQHELYELQGHTIHFKDVIPKDPQKTKDIFGYIRGLSHRVK